MCMGIFQLCLFPTGFEKKKMITYFLYNTILVGAATCSYLAERLNTKDSRIMCRVIVFLLLTVPASLRYYTGTDYGAYFRMFYNTQNLARREILWQVLNHFTALLHLPAQFIFVFSSILIYYPICFKLGRKHYAISIILYIVFNFYFKSFNGIRQMIAVSFILWAFVDFEGRKYIKTLLLYAIAIGFHTSALIIAPCFLLSFIRIRGKKLPFFFVIIMFALCLRLNMLQIILSALSIVGSKFARYANSSFYTSRMPLGSGLGVLSRLLFSLLAVFFYASIHKRHPEKRNVLNLSIIYIISYVLAAQYIILGRLRDIFIFVPLLISGYAIDAAGKYRKIALLALLSLNVFLFESDIRTQIRDTFSNSIYPYYSIFYQGEIR